jgi:hypothetical protein
MSKEGKGRQGSGGERKKERKEKAKGVLFVGEAVGHTHNNPTLLVCDHTIGMAQGKKNKQASLSITEHGHPSVQTGSTQKDHSMTLLTSALFLLTAAIAANAQQGTVTPTYLCLGNESTIAANRFSHFLCFKRWMRQQDPGLFRG